MPDPVHGEGRGAPRGARLLFLAQSSRAIVLLAGVTVLSRILAPADFGYVALAVAIVGIGEILRDLGLSTAAISKPDLSTNERDVLFFANAAIGITLAVALCVLSPVFADLFGAQQLATVLPPLSVVFITNGISAQYRADLNRTMRFSALAVVDSVGPLSGVIAAILLAALGLGYWALVFQVIVASTVSLMLLGGLGRWLPAVPRSIRDAIPLLRFGLSVSGAQILGYLGTNVDTFALGYGSTPIQLGYYNRAFQVGVQAIGLLRDPATAIALPMMSRVSGDPVALGRAAATAQRLLAYTIVPIASLVAATAVWFVPVVLGSNWESISPIVAILAVAGALQVLATIASWILIATGQGRHLVAYSAVSLAVKATCIGLALQWGAIGVAWGYFTAIVIMWPAAIWWASSRAGISAPSLLRSCVLPVSLATVSALAAASVPRLLGIDGFWAIGVAVVVFGLPYAACASISRVRAEYVSVATAFTRRNQESA